MLKSILKLDGAQELGKEEKKQISGGFPSSNGICLGAGDFCSQSGPYEPPIACMAGPLNLCCVGGLLVEIHGDHCN